MDWFYSDAQSKFGRKRIDNYMQINANESEAIKAFLNQIEQHIEDYKLTRTVPSLSEFITACYERPNHPIIGIAKRFSDVATSEELNELADIAIKEDNPRIKLNLLWVFRNRSFPLNESYIFELAESDDEEIRETAFEMMQQLTSDFVHDYAISLVTKGKDSKNSISLLCHCYRPEDETLLKESVKKLVVTYDDQIWHEVYGQVNNLLGRSSLRINPDIFIHMYRHTLCSVCRSGLVRNMYKKKILPNEILEECLYDSYDETRKFAERKLRMRT